MEGQPVVEAAADQRLDPLDMVRREVRAQQDLDRPAVRQLEDQLVRRIGGDLRRARRCSAAAGGDRRRLGGDQRNAANGSANKALLNITLPEKSRAPSARGR